MALNDQMQQMIRQDVQDAETRPKKEILKEQMDVLKSIGRGSITSPVTGVADTVEAGKMLPELDDKVKPFAPTYTGIEAAFEKLYNLGINRKTAEKAIKDVTGIELKGDTGELIGEFISPVAATKAVNAIASSAVKYGSTEAPKAISRISAEAKKLFSDSGGFDDLATATAGSTRGQTRKILDKRPLPDTSITKIIIGQSGKDYDKKVASYNKAKQQLIPGKNRVDDQDAQELWNRTGAQEDVVDNDIVYEVPTAKAKLKFKESDLFDYKEGRASFDPKNEVTLKDILDFDELYEQAPYLKNVQVKRLNGFQRLQGTKAAYNPESNTIFIASGSPTNLTSDLLHEVEHAVQAADGKAFGGGNFRKILRADPEYNKLGGADGKRELKKAEDDIIKKYGGKVSGKKEIVRNFLRTYRKIPDPKKFIDTVRALPKITKTDRTAHAGVFRYMKDVDEFMDNQFPEIDYEYTSQIIDTLSLIRDSSPKRIKSILSDIEDKKIMDLKKFDDVEKRAVLKYLRDPGEVTARNVQFRFLTSKKDPSITRVAPRLTEDRYAGLSEQPYDITEKPPTKSAEQLSKEAAEKGVSLTDEGYYLANKAEQTGGDAAQSLGKQTSEAFAKPLEIGTSEFAKSGKLLKNYDASTLQEITEKGKLASAGNSRANKLIGADVAEGSKVGVRLNLNSNIPDMPLGLNKLQTVHKNNYNGQALSYRPYVTVKNAVFNVNQKGRAAVAAKIKGSQSEAAKSKYNLASVDGNITSAKNALSSVSGDVVEIGFNPASTHLFIDLSTGQAVKSAEVATVVGDRVYAKGVTYLKKAEAPEAENPDMFTFNDGTEIPSEVRYKMKKGGAVPMNNMAKQMELFDEGGLMDEGGTIDPVSGNNVPPGSTQEEVRDDIPAQLSEGEFVFPADVVRFIGLEKLMKIRQRAKAGLRMMEDMGQMGNSEEAIMPDDLPFSIDDLDMEDDGLEMNQGGLVNMSNGGMIGPLTTGLPATVSNALGSQVGQVGSFNPQIPGSMGMNPLGTAAAPMQAASSLSLPQPTSGVDPNLGGTAFTPTTIQPVQQTFQQAVGAGVPGVDFEYVEYVNESGQIVRLRRNKFTKEMLDPIPEGFTEKTDATQTQTTTGTGVQTATVTDDGDGGGDSETQNLGTTMSFGGEIGPDGNVINAVRGTVSYRGKNFGTGPFGLGGIKDVKGLFGRSIMSGFNQVSGGKFGTPMTLEKGESVIVEDLIQSVPGVNRSYSLGKVGLELDSDFYNKHISGKRVTERQRLKEVAKFVAERYGLGKERLADGSILNASLISDQIDLEKSRADRRAMVELAQETGDFSAVINDAIQDAKDYAESAGRSSVTGIDDEAFDAGYGKGTPAAPAPAPASSVFGTDYSGPPQDEGPGGGDNTNDGPQGDEATGGSVGDDMYSGDG